MFLHHPGSLDKLVPLVLASITAGTLTLTACSPATEHHDFSAKDTTASSVTPNATDKVSPSPTLPSASPSTPSPEPKKILAGKTIVIDPGHSNGQHLTNKVPDGRGGSKPCNTSGTATNSGYPEHTANWKVALILQTELQEKGATVHLTKKDDHADKVRVDRRGQIPNEKHADAFLSIHANGSQSSAPHGFFVMVSNPPLNSAQGEPSRKLARAVSEGLRGAGLTPSTIFGADPATRSDLDTLNFAKVPAVMVELGEMRNPQDAQRLSSPQGQQQYASGLAKGIISFLSAS
ncbi:N-acetylmuramoyl-L-alanine amidase [Varibaculum cambriense]|uniref:N-acetylmuramoyl-L-alanine amidase family protein n=1 Tax=Varibaculum cambriense TaxID=184870 RepID=UPI00241D04E7|nr:N-acetylmuramoyl-L-alanine amidase [Varibaculum cambriense]MBS5963317.1 N-acetylmuramoyl-L-alanine amidase [Varibaculum cambriense]